ncbi:DNA/RNA nuclease SfsA [Gallaecimonas mangrovi]|uniref:DNA/RNA nuclease SfsA n=1 Tax=Gallaecimonas mangrovi TaxID=2291597 RepID=UPI000E1FBEC3|nr:DNA/RNA nuclease SfsA [Gallaecimonas mangrovi]
MKFQPVLEKATLIKRYKRFLADIDSARGPLTIHCANTGAMTGCGEPGDTIWFRYDPSPKKKLPGSWELTEKDGQLICINTARANAIVKEALLAKRISELAFADTVLPEQDDGAGSRVDFVLEGQGRKLWLEVKSVTLLLENGIGAFPDAKSARALKHLDALVAKVQAGEEAALLFTVLHSGIEQVKAAEHIDPVYAQRLKEVADSGVKLLARKAAIGIEGLVLDKAVKVII